MKARIRSSNLGKPQPYPWSAAVRGEEHHAAQLEGALNCLRGSRYPAAAGLEVRDRSQAHLARFSQFSLRHIEEAARSAALCGR